MKMSNSKEPIKKKPFFTNLLIQFLPELIVAMNLLCDLSDGFLRYISLWQHLCFINFYNRLHYTYGP